MTEIHRNQQLRQAIEREKAKEPVIFSLNQSVENSGVAFVKRANERNEFFEKNKQTVMYDEQSQGRTDKLPQVTEGWYIIALTEQYSGYIYFQSKKKVLQSSMPRVCLF